MSTVSTMSRINYLDTARGWAILLVVLGHAIQYTVANFDENVLFRLIYAVHMPLFMFISGYVTLPSDKEKLAKLTIKARQLLLPFLFWLPVSYLAIIWVQRPEGSVTGIWPFIVQVLKNPDAGGLWFLLVLFECHVLLQAATLAGSRRSLSLGMLMLIALNVLVLLLPACNWLGIGLLRWYFLFFLLGFALRQYGWQPPARVKSWLWLLVFVILASFWYRKSATPVDLWLPHLGASAKLFAVQGYHAITALAGIVAFLGLFAALERATVLRGFGSLLNKLGRASLEIYAGHYLFLYVALRVSADYINVGVQTFFVATIALLGAWTLARMLAVHPLPRRLFYGR
ncbi:MAG TPA: acyltransferase family protein [Gallionellaceae bacterium]